jgi:hypothetical protein
VTPTALVVAIFSIVRDDHLSATAQMAVQTAASDSSTLADTKAERSKAGKLAYDDDGGNAANEGTQVRVHLASLVGTACAIVCVWRGCLYIYEHLKSRLDNWRTCCVAASQRHRSLPSVNES